MNKVQNNSYNQILKSTSLIGGSQVINIILGIIRTKVLALLLGPSGVGLMGLYNSVSGTVNVLTGMGINSSGIRQIAEAVGTGDNRRISITIITLRRTVLILGLIGMTFMLLFREQISQFTFSNNEYSFDLAILSLAVVCVAISGGQTALIQGMRRVAELAKINVLSAVTGTVLSIIIIYFLRHKGIAWFLVAIAASTIFFSWWHARKINISRIRISWQDYHKELKGLFRLGLVFMSSGVMTMGTTYFLGVMVVRYLGLEATGIYQAAVTLSSVYIGVILSAMSADFYPRLTAVAEDNEICNRLINEQAEVGVLLAVPGIIATIIFAPFVIRVFYSSIFDLSVDVLRWQILGVFLRVTCWPMSYLLIAKGAGKTYFLTECIANIIYIIFTWIGIRLFGIVGTGMAFFGLYAFYWLLIYYVVRIKSGFRWSNKNLKIFIIFIPLVIAAFLSAIFLEQTIYTLIGFALLVLSIVISYRNLLAVAGISNFYEFVLMLKTRFGFR